MAKRDPNKTARNKLVGEMQDELRVMLPDVLAKTKYSSEGELNARIGHKAGEFIDLKNAVILSPDHYVEVWTEGFKENLASGSGFQGFYNEIKKVPALRKYVQLFLRRSYLKHHDELSKKRPHTTEAEIWMGQNNADYGLLVTPRFVKGEWENDQSEIRHFRPRYWTIGHVLETGLVIPSKKSKMTFHDVDQYLNFFENVLIRGTASTHQKAIASLYSDYVRNASDPSGVALLIPEFRYDGRLPKHKYRLDFTVIDGTTMDKVGFELSPWSSHGLISGTKGKSQKVINAEASDNFDNEMKKHKDFFKKHGVFALIYTDVDLKKPKEIFADVARYLKPGKPPKQHSFHFDNFFK